MLRPCRIMTVMLGVSFFNQYSAHKINLTLVFSILLYKYLHLSQVQELQDELSSKEKDLKQCILEKKKLKEDGQKVRDLHPCTNMTLPTYRILNKIFPRRG